MYGKCQSQPTQFPYPDSQLSCHQMASGKKLDSPIELPDRRRTVLPVLSCFPMPPARDCKYPGFVKEGSPYDRIGRFFVGFKGTWNGISAIEFKEGRPVAFISQCSIVGKDAQLKCLTKALHPNILSLREVFFSKDTIFFIYEQWGITMSQIQGLSPEFQLGEVEVATICKGVLYSTHIEWN